MNRQYWRMRDMIGVEKPHMHYNRDQRSWVCRSMNLEDAHGSTMRGAYIAWFNGCISRRRKPA